MKLNVKLITCIYFYLFNLVSCSYFMSTPAFLFCHSSLFFNNPCNAEMRYNVEHFVMDFILPHLRWFLESWIFRMKIDGWRERSVTRVVVDIVVLYPPFDLSLTLSHCLCFSLTHTHTLFGVSVCVRLTHCSLWLLWDTGLSVCACFCACV